MQTARDLFSKAEKDEDAGHWAEALDKLQRASAVKMTAGIRFHMALCEEKLGKLTAAWNDYGATESQARAENNKEVLDAVSEPIAQLRARVPTLTINVGADAKDAQVVVDGAPLPSSQWGTPRLVDIGSHVVQATLASRAPFLTTVNLWEREAKTVDVKLLPIPAPTPTAATAALPTPPAETPHHPARTRAIVATTAAVLLGAGGAASFLIAGSKQSDAIVHCAQVPNCDDVKGPIRTFDWMALGAWVGAAAAATFAIVLWVRPAPVAPTSVAHAPAARTVRPAAAASEGRAEIVVGPGSLVLRGQF